MRLDVPQLVAILRFPLKKHTVFCDLFALRCGACAAFLRIHHAAISGLITIAFVLWNLLGISSLRTFEGGIEVKTNMSNANGVSL